MNEHNQAGMSAAEFKTAHDALGVSTAFLAERIGVSSGRVWKYESAERGLPVPAHAAEVMRDLLSTFVVTATEMAAAAAELGFIPRHSDLTEFEALYPDMAGWGAAAQGAVIAHAQAQCQLPVDYV